MRKKKKIRKNPRTTKRSQRQKRSRIRRLPLGKSTSVEVLPVVPRGLGPPSAGQSGDIQGLSGVQSANSESVVELVEEGQDYEAEVVSGVENVPEADEEERLAEEILGERTALEEAKESPEEVTAEAGGPTAGHPRGRAPRSNPSGGGGR